MAPITRSVVQCVLFSARYLNMYLLSSKRFLNGCDGALIASSHSYEGAALIQIEEWFKSLPQNPLPLYSIGPLLPPGYGRPSVQNSASEKSQGEDVQVFLKEMQAKKGEKSVVFVGFSRCHGTSTPNVHYYSFRSLLGRSFGLQSRITLMRSYKGLLTKEFPLYVPFFHIHL